MNISRLGRLLVKKHLAERFVRIGQIFNQLEARVARLGAHVGRDLVVDDIFPESAVKVDCTLADNVDKTTAVGLKANGQLDEGGVVLELGAQLVQYPVGVGPGTVQFVNESNAGYPIPRNR